MLLERAVGRKQLTFSWCPVSVAAVYWVSRTGRGTRLESDAMPSRSSRATKIAQVAYPPHIVSEANKLQEGYWRKKTTLLEPVLVTRQDTLGSVWL
jgi:hypothetical protein